MLDFFAGLPRALKVLFVVWTAVVGLRGGGGIFCHHFRPTFRPRLCSELKDQHQVWITEAKNLGLRVGSESGSWGPEMIMRKMWQNVAKSESIPLVPPSHAMIRLLLSAAAVRGNGWEGSSRLLRPATQSEKIPPDAMESFKLGFRFLNRVVIRFFPGCRWLRGGRGVPEAEGGRSKCAKIYFFVFVPSFVLFLMLWVKSCVPEPCKE